MGVSIVQKAPPVFSGGAAVATFGTQPIVGNLVVVFSFAFGAPGTPTDNHSGVYTVQASKADTNGNNISVATAPITATGATYSITAGANGVQLFAYELTGWDGTTVLDGSATTATDVIAFSNITTARDGALILLGVIDQSTKTDWLGKVNGNLATQEDHTANVDSNFSWYYGPNNAGTYTPAVTSATNASTFSAAALAIKAAVTAPTITQQPASATINDGDYWYGWVLAADNSGTGLTYQWQQNTGSGFSDILGQTTNYYTGATVLHVADSGIQYRCNVTNGIGTTASAAATITIQTPRAGTAGEWDLSLLNLGWW